MAKRRLIKSMPRPDGLSTFAEVKAYLEKLVTAIEDDRPSIFTGDIILGTTAPDNNTGKNGDLYVKY